MTARAFATGRTTAPAFAGVGATWANWVCTGAAPRASNAHKLGTHRVVFTASLPLSNPKRQRGPPSLTLRVTIETASKLEGLLSSQQCLLSRPRPQPLRQFLLACRSAGHYHLNKWACPDSSPRGAS